ncbi:RNA-binding domain-containing protein [Adlercreutzia sp. ZJ242]|uniref:RNA-binding domain-containing protein n=1 Tax=Adlercreutzia sp. ZJ242 TaxID=2709409 RepID=UPI00197DB2EF|nr:RNA-binding domain-containing protein [Adlercreutzia sp. ZJ242]
MAALREIPKSEDLDCEFKSDLKKLSDNELVDTVIALSNTKGGVIYLGVEDDGKPTGIHKDHADVVGLSALVSNRTMPPVSVRAAMLQLSADGLPDENGVKVMSIEVPRSIAIVASTDGKILRRRLKADGTPESVPMYPYEIITRLSTIGQLDYSSFPLPNANIDDFSREELTRLRDILFRNRNNGDQSLLELPDDEMLSALRMITVVDGRAVPTVTGILLAGKPEAISRCMPTSGATFQVLEGTEVRVNQDFDQPLLYTIEKMREMLDPWNPEREYEAGLFRQSVPEFDRRAFREALVNAFGHRDYAALGRVRVLIDDEGLTISNPGGFVEGVTIDNLLTVEPHGRNECLMGALKRIGLAEKTGRGVDRIYEGSLYCGRPLPDYSASTSASVVVFIARSAPDKLFMRMINEEQERAGRPLSLRALLVLDALKRQRRLTVADLRSQLHATDSVTRATVENLVEAGLVEGIGNTSNRSYMLSSKVYARSGKSTDFVRQSDIDRVRYPELIMKLARQQGGKVIRRDVEELLHLSEKQAYRELSKLVDEGSLKSAGRGRGSHYSVV